jgi:uncharacterized protein (DUF488 family)
MTVIYTIGFTKKSLEEFINLLKQNNITKLVDIRLNRVSQLAGFAKEKDLKYILEKLFNIKYKPINEFAPTKELLKKYIKDNDWENYAKEFKDIIDSRNLEDFKDEILDEKEIICFLCAEAEPEKCHRRLIAEFFGDRGNNVEIKHL